MDLSSARICGDGVARDVVNQVAAKLALPVWDGNGAEARAPAAVFDAARGNQPIILLSKSVDPDLIERALSATVVAVVEDGPADKVADTLSPVLGHRPDLVLSLNTDTVYKLPLAHLFSQAVSKRAALSEATAMDMELALHECLANAIIHGNMELSSELRGSVSKHVVYVQLLNKRLGEAPYAQRRVTIEARFDADGVWVAVTDQGLGFDFDPNKRPDPTKASGRGLDIIRSLSQNFSVSDGGRRSTMFFRK